VAVLDKREKTMNQRSLISRLTTGALFAAMLAIGGCGGGDSNLADSANVALSAPRAGATPFIATVDVTASNLDRIRSVRFRIDPKPNATSRPASASFFADYLYRRGLASQADGRITVPVFGLYAGWHNTGVIELEYDDGSIASTTFAFDAATYVDPTARYDRPLVRVPRAAGSKLGFDFFYMKSSLGPPIIVDTDGEIRWVGAGVPSAISSIFRDNGFVVGVSMSQLMLRRLELDGSVTGLVPVQSTTYTTFHHNFDLGKSGTLVEVDAEVAGAPVIESILAEVAADGTVIAEWNFEDILRRHMLRAGDDPTILIRPGVDWFHMNSATYDPRDDSIIASSRENFVIKVDYKTGEIIWIFGDPTKYWYTVPSLRAKSLSLTTGGLYPIGQHSLSLLPTGDLLMFNNGLNALHAPAGQSAGETRAYSVVSAFAIDGPGFGATESWRFEYGQSISSLVCSSAYQTPDGSTLVIYATADNGAHARLVGLNPQRQVVFDLQYDSPPCAVGWNSQPVPLEALVFK
jgi:arylsulfate sulfotransferase